MKTRLTNKTAKFVDELLLSDTEAVHGKLNSKASVKEINKQFAAARKAKRQDFN